MATNQYGNATPEREAQVVRHTALLEKGIAELIEAINVLESRLTAVLRDEENMKPTPLELGKAERLVPLATDLLVKFNKIMDQVARLNAIRDRIEI